ncbi:MAG: hypothetical protein SWH61_10440 [Thermodesulfobacteriota bacterium]|nr:hypothetical protein [Thermodesulfobacteriota bacterium]
MNLSEIKTRFRHRSKADLTDIDLALEALPMMVREVESLETRLAEAEKRIAHLSRKQPPLYKKGKKGAARWDVRVDETKNRLYLKLSGRFDPASAKLASNHIISISFNLREGFDLINDVTELTLTLDKKVIFHIRKVIYHLEQAGLKRAARVVTPENQNTSHLFAKILPDTIPSETAATMEEAEAMLESASRFLKS